MVTPCRIRADARAVTATATVNDPATATAIDPDLAIGPRPSDTLRDTPTRSVIRPDLLQLFRADDRVLER